MRSNEGNGTPAAGGGANCCSAAAAVRGLREKSPKRKQRQIIIQ